MVERQLTIVTHEEQFSSSVKVEEHKPAEISSFEFNLFRDGRLDFDHRASAKFTAKTHLRLKQYEHALDTGPSVSAQERATKVNDWVNYHYDLFDWSNYVNGEVPANWAYEPINIIDTFRQARKGNEQLSDKLINAAIIHPAIYVRTSVALSQSQYLNEQQQELLNELGVNTFDQEHRMHTANPHSNIVQFERHITDVQQHVQPQTLALVA